MKKSVPVFVLIWIFCCLINSAHTAIAFAANPDGEIYYFDPDNLSAPATQIFPLMSADNITSSPDGNTMYFTDETTGDVYSFPTYGPYILTLLNSQIQSIGIAVSNDSKTVFVATDAGVPGIYAIPATGGPVTQLTPTGIAIPTPLFLAINGDTLYIGDFSNGQIYSTPISSSSTTYDATLLQTTSGVGGLAVSSDGYLYWSSAYGGRTGDWIYRVPIAAPTSLPTLVGTGPSGPVDGLTVSCDGTTVFLTILYGNPGVYSIPTNQGLPQPATQLTSLLIPEAIDIAVAGCNVFPPTNLKGFQKKYDFGLVYKISNILSWSASVTNGVLFYRIYRNGSEVATVNAGTSTYQDHDIQKGVTTSYSIYSVTQSGAESSPINITIP